MILQACKPAQWELTLLLKTHTYQLAALIFRTGNNYPPTQRWSHWLSRVFNILYSWGALVSMETCVLSVHSNSRIPRLGWRLEFRIVQLQYTRNSELTQIFYSCIALRIQVFMLTRHSTVAVHSELKFPWYWSFHGILLLQYTQNSSHPANKDIYQSQCARNSSLHANQGTLKWQSSSFHATQDILKWQSSSSMLPRIFYSHSAHRTPTSWTGTIFFDHLVIT